MGSIWTFMLIWGVWLITPVLVDGLEALIRLLIVRSRRRDSQKRRELEEHELPTVSIIVPAHNEAAVIDRCLNSVKAQDYPHEKLEVIVIDDGSTDTTAEQVENHVSGGNGNGNGSFRLRGKPIMVGPFGGSLALLRNAGNQGKAVALNAGIDASRGEIVINIDSDVVLAPNAVRSIAASFARNPRMGAATGNIEIDWEILESRDSEGRLVLDEDGEIVPKRLNIIERFLVRSQFLEYLSSFDLGRRAQAETSTMYTLAGACSAFRRAVLEAGTLYCNDTVSEDTNLTFDLHKQDVTIGFIDDAKIYLEPVIDWDSLYAQRVRWTRGQLEVCGVNEELIGRSTHGAFSRFAVPKMLLFDHTLAFPRLIWAPLILCFPLIGYSWRVIILAVIAMYLFYLAIEVVSALAVFAVSDEHTRNRIERSGWALITLPIYRFIVFHFRFSGFLVTLTEEQQWTMTGPMRSAENDFNIMRLRSIELLSGLMSFTRVSTARLVRVASAVIGPLAIVVSVTVLRVIDQWRRPS